MKKIILFILLTISTNVFAEWTNVGTSDSDSYNIYINYETIKKKGSNVKVWSMNDYKTVQKLGDNKTFLSTVTLNEYDCEEETSSSLDNFLYSNNMGYGDTVYSLRNRKDEKNSIVPESVDERIFKFACMSAKLKK